MNYKDELNDKQYEAVTTCNQFVRVVAGAGSGKTRVLTYRIAFLIEELGVNPWSILAITFTNKVANEMKQRVLKMLPWVSKDLNIRTFHSFAAFFLRHEITVLGFPQSFSILDEEDQTKIIKDVAQEMGFKRGDKIVGRAISYIGTMKLKEKYPEDITIIKPMFEDEKTCLEIYTRYEEEKNKILALDFDDLLLKANYILENYRDIRIKWQNRISQILVDEFQDTNDTEFKLLKLLMKPSTCLYVVGDPDQTIYTWRGANQNIILDMPKIYLDMESIILNENYRSTQTILNSANKLIANNKLRVAKDLYTKKASGDAIVTRSCPFSKNEAEYVAREILRLKQVEHYNLKDIAILYRSNYVTREFESELTQRGINYRIYGGMKFYQRREIKDILAYFHLITNIKDDVSFERIINVPRRGIGEGTTALIKEEAKNANLSLYEYIRDIDSNDSSAPRKAINMLKAMIELIDQTREKIETDDEVFSKSLEDLVYSINYYEYIQKEDDGEERFDNVKSLFEDIRHFKQQYPESSFDEYLQNIALISAQDELTDGDYVSLMTVHTAKGLEFPVVFVVRLNNGVFPSQRAAFEGGYAALEEERRLAYVAITRAMKKLYLTYSNDFSYVLGGTLTPSPFLKESGNEIKTSEYNPYRSSNPNTPRSYSFNDIPREYRGGGLSFEDSTPKKQDFAPASNDVKEWEVGDVVIHKKLGKGVVIELEGDDIIKVNFEEHGVKSILGTHPSVSKGGSQA